MEKEVIWTETALNQLENIYFYLLESTKSITVSEKVVNTIESSVAILKTKWEIYELDEMKQYNNGNYRAFEIYSYRISYRINENEIYIVRIRHISRNSKRF